MTSSVTLAPQQFRGDSLLPGFYASVDVGVGQEKGMAKEEVGQRPHADKNGDRSEQGGGT